MNKLVKFGFASAAAVGIAVTGAISASAYSSTGWQTNSGVNFLDGCTIGRHLGANFVTAIETPTDCLRDVGVQAHFRSGGSLYAGIIVWNKNNAGKVYYNGEKTYEIRVHHGNH